MAKVVQTGTTASWFWLFGLPDLARLRLEVNRVIGGGSPVAVMDLEVGVVPFLADDARKSAKLLLSTPPPLKISQHSRHQCASHVAPLLSCHGDFSDLYLNRVETHDSSSFSSSSLRGPS